MLLLILIRFTIFHWIKIKFYNFLIFPLSNLYFVSPKHSMYGINTKQKLVFINHWVWGRATSQWVKHQAHKPEDHVPAPQQLHKQGEGVVGRTTVLSLPLLTFYGESHKIVLINNLTGSNSFDSKFVINLVYKRENKM